MITKLRIYMNGSNTPVEFSEVKKDIDCIMWEIKPAYIYVYEQKKGNRCPVVTSKKYFPFTSIDWYEIVDVEEE